VIVRDVDKPGWVGACAGMNARCDPDGRQSTDPENSSTNAPIDCTDLLVFLNPTTYSIDCTDLLVFLNPTTYLAGTQSRPRS
jgi:hypothetical protein